MKSNVSKPASPTAAPWAAIAGALAGEVSHPPIKTEAATTVRLIDERRHLHRFDREAAVLAVRVFVDGNGKPRTVVSDETWQGL